MSLKPKKIVVQPVVSTTVPACTLCNVEPCKEKNSSTYKGLPENFKQQFFPLCETCYANETTPKQVAKTAAKSAVKPVVQEATEIPICSTCNAEECVEKPNPNYKGSAENYKPKYFATCNSCRAAVNTAVLKTIVPPQKMAKTNPAPIRKQTVLPNPTADTDVPICPSCNAEECTEKPNPNYKGSAENYKPKYFPTCGSCRPVPLTGAKPITAKPVMVKLSALKSQSF
jgi:hypothetical protein